MGALKGIRFLEFSGIGPGPYCGMVLADLGANVIRLSRVSEKGTYNKFDIHNRSKRTIVADLKNPNAIKEIKKLIKEVDVIFEGFRPGVMEKLGLSPEECFKLNKSLVYGRMTGWGQDGPMSSQAGHDINYISLSGALNAIGGISLCSRRFSNGLWATAVQSKLGAKLSCLAPFINRTLTSNVAPPHKNQVSLAHNAI